MEIPSLSHELIPADGVRLHAAVGGEGTPVILLHGFPENWTTWHHQIPILVDAGFRAIVPDLRGYGRSDRPREREAYRLSHLVEDIAALVRWSEHERATIIGHDWGGLIAWAFAERHPDLVERLVILNAPHPRIYRRRLFHSTQALRSWYILPAQVPILAESILSAGDFWLIRTMFRVMPARPDTFTRERIDAFVEDLSRPGALTAALEYYRANAAPRKLERVANKRILAPTLVLWGERDPALGVGLLEGLDEFVPDLSIVRLPDVGHWIQNEAPEEVNRRMIAFIDGG